MLSRFALVVIWLGLLSCTSGCAINRATATVTPDTDLSRVKKYYVVRFPSDTHGVDQLLREPKRAAYRPRPIGSCCTPSGQAEIEFQPAPRECSMNQLAADGKPRVSVPARVGRHRACRSEIGRRSISSLCSNPYPASP